MTPGKVEYAKQLLAAGNAPARRRPKSCRVGTNARQMVALVEPFLTRLLSLCWTTLQLGTLFRADDKTLSGRRRRDEDPRTVKSGQIGHHACHIRLLSKNSIFERVI